MQTEIQNARGRRSARHAVVAKPFVRLLTIFGRTGSAIRRPVVQRAEQRAEGDDDRGDDPVDHGIDAPLDLLKARAGRGNR